MPQYLRYAAADEGAARFTAEVFDGADPRLDPDVVNAENYRVREIKWSPSAAFSPVSAGAFTEHGIVFDGTQWWDWTESATDANDVPHTVDQRSTLWFASLIATADAEAQTLFSATNYAVGINAAGQPLIKVVDSNGSQSTIVGTSGPYTAGQRINVLWTTESDGGTGMRIRIAYKLASGAPTPDAATGAGGLIRARPDYDLTRAAFSAFSGATPGGADDGNMDTTLYGAALYAGGTIPNIAQEATWDAFVNADGTLKDPALADALLGVSPKIDTRGNDTAAMQAGTHRGTLGAAAVTGTF